jgi:hypothetical protein
VDSKYTRLALNTVIRVFPDINSQERNERSQWILVGSCCNLKLLGGRVESEPWIICMYSPSLILEHRQLERQKWSGMILVSQSHA